MAIAARTRQVGRQMRSRRVSSGLWAAVALLSAALMAAAGLALLGGSASAETPAQRCARETATYNAAWAQSWAAANGRPASQAPPPPVPYVCQDPGQQPQTTPTQPTVTVPTLPTTTTPRGQGAEPTVHAPTDLPEASRLPGSRTARSELPGAGRTAAAKECPEGQRAQIVMNNPGGATSIECVDIPRCPTVIICVPRCRSGSRGFAGSRRLHPGKCGGTPCARDASTAEL